MESPLRIEVVACESLEGDAGRWRVTFRVVNVGASVVRLSDAWVPHGRFRGEGHVPVHVEIVSGDAQALELGVTAREAPGTVVENAFLILRTSAGRVFARMRVEFGAAGQAKPSVEAVTAQP
ncbi:MAG: hypothetical protein JO352_33115 [Chloroflexi bacterium]|nr:hypothetical protein [Chloroflexota bacterium]MBV9599888.1 hypothetical protein [Chloroflexota bacterium]